MGCLVHWKDLGKRAGLSMLTCARARAARNASKFRLAEQMLLKVWPCMCRSSTYARMASRLRCIQPRSAVPRSALRREEPTRSPHEKAVYTYITRDAIGPP